MRQSKIPVIYILSSGRSGSTLLDLLLGAHPNIWTLGEAQRLALELRKNSLCGCGTPIAECGFWQTIIPNIPLRESAYPIEHFRANGGQGKIIHWGLLPGLSQGKIDGRWQQAVDIYGQVNLDYFRAVRQAATEFQGTDICWLVDASKDPYRLFWLQKSGLFDLRVIHLLKNPQAFVYSMIKRELPQARRKAIRMTGRWIVENSIGRRLCTAILKKEQTFLLHYENLAAQPEQTLSQIGDWLGLTFSTDMVNGFRDYENHAISGNQMRWQDLDICLDEKWRTLLPKSYSRAIQSATWPVRWIFNY